MVCVWQFVEDPRRCSFLSLSRTLMLLLLMMMMTMILQTLTTASVLVTIYVDSQGMMTMEENLESSLVEKGVESAGRVMETQHLIFAGYKKSFLLGLSRSPTGTPLHF
jgi:hypothetical protein